MLESPELPTYWANWFYGCLMTVSMWAMLICLVASIVYIANCSLYLSHDADVLDLHASIDIEIWKIKCVSWWWWWCGQGGLDRRHQPRPMAATEHIASTRRPAPTTSTIIVAVSSSPALLA